MLYEVITDLSMVADGNSTIEHNLPQKMLYDDVLQFWGQTNVAYTPTLVVTYGGLTAETYWRNDARREIVQAQAIECINDACDRTGQVRHRAMTRFVHCRQPQPYGYFLRHLDAEGDAAVTLFV